MLQLFGGEVIRVFGKLRIVVADESALHTVFNCKGSSGLKNCLLCLNVFNRLTTRRVVESDASGTAVYHDCHDYNQLRFHTTATHEAIVRRLRADVAVLGVTAFAALETDLGWNYSVRGLMFNPIALALCPPAECAVYDWMHIFFVTGIFNHHMGLLMRALRAHGISYEVVHQYVQKWSWPSAVKNHSANAVDVFSTNRAKIHHQASLLKCTASDGLSLLPVLALFFMNV